MTNQSEIERVKAMAGMLGMCRVLSDTDDELSDVYSFGDASACYMNGYKLIEISKIITANYTPNTALPEFMKPNGIIPYTTIDGVEYVALDWLKDELMKDKEKL